MSIVNEIRRGYYPETLGLDSVLDLANDAGCFDMAWLALEMESRAHSGEYCGVTFKDTPSKWGLNTLKKAAGKPLLNEPVLTRQAVKNMFDDLGIDSIPENTPIGKWIKSMESGPPMDHPGLLNWVDIGLWRLYEAAFLLGGEIPPDGQFDKSLHSGGKPAWIYQNLKDAIDLGELNALKTRTGYVQDKRLIPAAVVAWARANGYSIPLEVDSAYPDPGVKVRNHVDSRIDSLEKVFREIEKRTAEKDIGYHRDQTPGNKDEFREFLKRYDQSLSFKIPISNKRLSDDLNKLGVKFLPGNQKGKGTRFYITLFPDLYTA